MPDTRPRRLDQSMAVEASRAVPDPVSDQVRTRLRQLPVMLQTSGLAATLAFLYAKSGDMKPLERAYRDVSQALTERVVAATGLPAGTTTSALVRALGEMSAVDYQIAGAHARAFAGWMSRIAEGRTLAMRPDHGRAG